MKIAVVGLGFVGLMTALSLAEKGNKVVGYDSNVEKVSSLRKGELYFWEPGAKEVLTTVLGNHFFVDSTINESIIDCEIIILCLPSDALDDGSVDLSAINVVCHQIHDVLPQDVTPTIVIKSTVPPTTLSNKIKPLFSSLKRDKIAEKLVSCPEFLREGVAWNDVKYPDRIVIGTKNDESYKLVESIYAPFNAPIFRVSPESAEFIKYLSNTLLATLISFSNEMAECADKFGGINVKKAFNILHMDKRLKGSGISSYIYPGCGYGGYCLPKDTKAFYNATQKTAKMLGEVIRINEERTSYIANYICDNTDVDDGILVLGLTFKPETDDIRESASIKIIRLLLEKNRKNIVVYDPIAMHKANSVFGDAVRTTEDPQGQLKKCDAVVLLTAWDEFLAYDYRETKLIDCRYLIDI